MLPLVFAYLAMPAHAEIAAGFLVGLQPCNTSDPLQQWSYPTHKLFAALRLTSAPSTCIGVTKADCDGQCLVTKACSGADVPLWAMHQEVNASIFRVVGGAAVANSSCLDFESKVGHLQAFPVCTHPLGNQAWKTEPTGQGLIEALFGSRQPLCIAVLNVPAPPPPSPPMPLNKTQDLLWRPSYHPTGWGMSSAGHLQDPAAPYQDANGLWHVLPDCWPQTWNDNVEGGDEADQLGWCHLTSQDLVRWERQPPSVWYDPTPAAANGSGFHGNCGTGGGRINSRGQLVAYCPHDLTGVHTFIMENASATSFASRLSLVDRAPAGAINRCTINRLYC
jgi:hypothetical protein